MNKANPYTELRRQRALAYQELEQLEALRDSGVNCVERIKEVERQIEKLERITR